MNMPAAGRSDNTSLVPKPPIALLSDFGTRDGYIGAVKGVLCSLAPGVPILDITHDIPPDDIAAARWTLLNCVAQFPPGTVFWAVVDPGVGTERPPLAVGYGRRWFVAPGNGILDWVLGKSAHAVLLQADKVGVTHLSNTFHGRDLFAPAAARLATDDTLESLGEPLPLDAALLGIPKPRRDKLGWIGEVLGVDRFGNAVTNLSGKLWQAGCRLAAGSMMLEGCFATYDAIPEGKSGILIGSLGTLEAAMQGKSFAAESGVIAGDKVRWFG
jgi:S-adenosyl-L-methionine hydrolase (adenosine-forming)